MDELLQYGGEDYSMEIPAPGKANAALAENGSNPAEARQWLPPDNDEPGFSWPDEGGTVSKSAAETGAGGYYVLIKNLSTFFKSSDSDSSTLAENQKCVLSPNAKYKTLAMPDFYGDHVVAELDAAASTCPFTKGYIYMPHVSATSAGGASQLPANIRAFLDTLAHAEGTEENYNLMFTFAEFKDYKDHPRDRQCSGKLCSDAAGRYQFLSKTWDPLAEDLGLKDFTPPNQDKAVLELIRRAGAYTAVSKSSEYANFTKALNKLNGIWASLPGSPYGQPTHSTASLWNFYKKSLAKYK